MYKDDRRRVGMQKNRSTSHADDHKAKRQVCWVCQQPMMISVSDSKGRKVHVPCRKWAEMGYASLRDVKDLPPLGIDEIQRRRNEDADNGPARIGPEQ